ncbi:HAD family hydrolase [Nocardioides mangrovicus]|uniref:HAD family hydrolase n=1 Tax=Nocardioides mangrovicus TaxID=2478913 RepID=A0A3L8P426_9ACTN|nr:HAD-IA family hydrolase [Nocardioides mangrovicus]RLV49188.1 HAD family hydrolase [Nocardioides mangrovicus]
MSLLMLDLDDTLVVREPVLRAWGERLIERHSLRVDLDGLVELEGGGLRDRHEVYDDLVAAGFPGSFDDFTDAQDDVARGYRLTDETRQALEQARAAGWTLAVVTNGFVRRQEMKLRGSGLYEMVDAVCISEEVGVRKPDPLIFATAAARAGATLEGAWMVGDNVDADILGAHRAGVRSVQLPCQDHRLEFTSGAQADLQAADVADAVAQILTLERAPASSRSS